MEVVYKKRDRRTHARTGGLTAGWTDNSQTLVRTYYTFFSNDKSGYNKGQVFQSNMSKNTVDGNCMTKIMLIVMFSTNPVIREKKYTN